MPKNFVSTDGKGFQITFANGLTASVQWGFGNYCNNYFKHNLATYFDNVQCDNAEVAVFNGDDLINIDPFLPEGCDHDETVAGFVTPEQVVYFLRKVSEYDPNATIHTNGQNDATERTAHIIIHNEFDVTNCADCPHAKGINTEDPYDGEKHFYCYATPDHKMIKSYLWHKSELKGIPEWCPCMAAK